MAQNTIPKNQRSAALDLLRFLAVLIVFFAHYTDTFNYVYHIVPENLKWLPISKYGSLALLIFFMVSGYVITMTSMKKNLKEFAITRLSRLYPLFWVSCITAFLLPRLIHEHTYLMYSHAKIFLANMTMMPAVFGYDMINPVYWTLLVELVFYFFIAIIILFKLWDKILIVISLLLIYCIVFSWKGASSLNLYLPSFLGGMLLYFIKIEYKSLWKLYSLFIANYICVLAAWRISAKDLDKFYKVTGALNLWVVITLVTIIYLILYLATIKINLISNKITHTLGEIAYPLYLFHIYFLYLYWYFRNTIQPGMLVLIILLIVLATSWILNVTIEKPLSKLAARVLSCNIGLFTRKRSKGVYVSGEEPPL